LRAIGHSFDMDVIETAPDRREKADRRAGRDLRGGQALTDALARDEIEILFQPQFSAAENLLVGAEALARWHHPNRGRIGVGALFEIAERTGRVRELSRHLVGKALAAAVQWPVPLRLSLNVTAADVAAGNFAETICEAAAEAGFPPEHLVLEITEQVLVTDLTRSAEQLRLLAERGVGIALDDFGAGFCNFHYLKRLPLHFLKLDRSMIDGIDEDPRDLAVLRGILAMARALGLEVCAEGIERDAQLAVIAREGCSSWQGFLGAKPVPAAEFSALTA
jgi:EAL domain-containing protein (putative c-di-GMP-specific phosphodiesterase class I)